MQAVAAVEPWLRERAEVIVDADTRVPWDGGSADFVVTFGGDGMVLGAAGKYAPHGVPVFGINVGKLGFLTETPADLVRDVLTDVLEDRYEIVERMMLRCALERDGRTIDDTVGLNDAVISRTALSRLMTIDLLVNEELVTTYSADGLIVATPVGSTAHSLAAGGPIVHPQIEGFVVCPICPHTLSNRPIMLPAGVAVEMRPQTFAEAPSLTVDGQRYRELEAGDRVLVSAAEKKFRLIRVGRRSFFETLRNKLGWSGQPRYGR